jgi:hypothetical protein
MSTLAPRSRRQRARGAPAHLDLAVRGAGADRAVRRVLPRVRAVPGRVRASGSRATRRRTRTDRRSDLRLGVVNTIVFLAVAINLKMAVALCCRASSPTPGVDPLAVGAFILPWAVPSIPTILSFGSC